MHAPLKKREEPLMLVKYLLIMPPVQDSAKDIVNFFFDRMFFIFDKSEVIAASISYITLG